MPVPRRFDRRPPERDQTRINDRIRVPEVRLIDETGKQVGVVKTPDALRYAEQHDLDLVEVAPDARPPVCRVLDYSKYKYEQAQKLKAARKHQTQITIREIKFRPKIAAADYDTKKGHVERFLRGKDKVKVTIMFRGREQAHPERGTALLQRLAEELSEVAVVEQTPLQDGRNMTMMLGPSKSVLASEDEGHAHGGAAGDAAAAAHQGKTSRRNRAAAVAAGLPEPVKAEPSKAALRGKAEEPADEAESADEIELEDASASVEPDEAEVVEREPAVEAVSETEVDAAGDDEDADEEAAESEDSSEAEDEFAGEAETETSAAKPKRAPAAAKTTSKPAATKTEGTAAKTATKPAATKAATTTKSAAAKPAATKSTAATKATAAKADADAESDAPAPRTRRRTPAAAESDS